MICEERPASLSVSDKSRVLKFIADQIASDAERKQFERYIETSSEVSQDEKDALAQLSEDDRRALFS